MTEQVNSNPPPPARLHLWQITAIRELFWIALLACALFIIFALRAILTPVVIAFALAYAVDPLVRAARRRLHIPRVVTMLFFLAVLLGAATLFVTWLLPQFMAQATELAARLPTYWNTIQARVGAWQAATTQATSTMPAGLEPIDPHTLVKQTLTGAGQVVGVLGTAFGTATYLVLSAILIPILFVFCGTYYERIHLLREYLPSSHRDTILDIIAHFDVAFSAYIRGQLVVALFTTTGFCIGFYLAGVPYWFVISLIGGTLSLIPYGQMSGWILAIAFKYAETLAAPELAFSWTGVLLAPSLVYLVTQSMESWVITPLVQGEALKLHPIVVLVVLLIGAAVGGIVGLILAVPLAGASRNLFATYLRPRLRDWAAHH